MEVYKIAITGGIGSGKTTVSNTIKKLGFMVVSCDDVYKELLKNEDFVLKISSAIQTPPLVDEKGTFSLNKTEIAKKAFSDRKWKKILEDATHPSIMQEVFKQTENCAIAFVEVPLLFEANLQNNFNHVIIVTSPLEKRISAVMKRDGITDVDVINRIKNQINYENFINNEHTIIENDGSLEELEIKVGLAIEKIIKTQT